MHRLGALLLLAAACGGHGDGAAADAPQPDGAAGDAAIDGAASESNRDRLIRTYLERLHAMPDVVQANGLRGADLPDACALWSALDPSARSVFLTITARLDGSTLAADGSTMLDHATRMTRLRGGEGATATDPGMCGGGEGNRLFVTVDPALHAALVAAHGGGADLADIPAGAKWRQSNDAAGPHAPFDQSDETERGAPRGQVQYFADVGSAAANAPLGRDDVQTLVDPYAMEMDEDFDCVHASNPMCEYTFYGPLCAPETTQLGIDIFTGNYGSYLPAWKPAGC